MEGFHTLGFYLIYYSLLGLYNKFRRGSRFDVQSQRGSKARIQIEAAHPSSTQTISRRVKKPKNRHIRLVVWSKPKTPGNEVSPKRSSVYLHHIEPGMLMSRSRSPMRPPDEVYPSWPPGVVLCREPEMLMSRSRSPMRSPMRYQGPDSKPPATRNLLMVWC